MKLDINQLPQDKKNTARFCECIITFLRRYKFNVNTNNIYLKEYIENNCCEIHSFLNKFKIKYHVVNLPEKKNCYFVLNNTIYLVIDERDEKIIVVSLYDNNVYKIDRFQIEETDFIVIDQISSVAKQVLNNYFIYKIRLKEFINNMFLFIGEVICYFIIGMIIYYNAYNMLLLFDQYVYYNSSYLINKTIIIQTGGCILLLITFYIINCLNNHYSYIVEEKRNVKVCGIIYFPTPIFALTFSIVLGCINLMILVRINDIIFMYTCTNFITLILILVSLVLSNLKSAKYEIIKRIIIYLIIIFTFTLFFCVLFNLLAKNSISIGMFAMFLILYCTTMSSLIIFIKDYRQIKLFYKNQYSSMLEITLSKDYKNNYDINYKKIILNGIKYIELDFNEINVALLYGRSRSGKTYYAKTLCGLNSKTNDNIFIDGINIRQIDINILNESSIYIGEDNNEYIEVSNFFGNDHNYFSYMDINKISEFIDLKGALHNLEMKKLSYTDILFLNVSMAIFQDKKIIIFDNVFSRLDSINANSILDLLSAMKIKCILFEQKKIMLNHIDVQLSIE